MEEDINRFIELLIKLLEPKSTEQSNLTKEEEDEFEKSCQKLMFDMIENPGSLIVVKNPEKLKAYKVALQKLAELYPDENIFDEFIGGELSHIMEDEMSKYIGRAKQLLPTFIRYKPQKKQIELYYNEAMRCWLFGLNQSAIIILGALIEMLLNEKIDELPDEDKMNLLNIMQEDSRYTAISLNLNKLINIAGEKDFISQESVAILHKFRKIRNKVVHNGKKIDSNETSDLIQNIKQVIEELYS